MHTFHVSNTDRYTVGAEIMSILIPKTIYLEIETTYFDKNIRPISFVEIL